MTPAGPGVIAGRLSTRTGPSFRAPTLDMGGTLSSSIRYDGSSLTLSSVAYRSPAGELRAGGRLDTLWGTATAQLAVDGTLDLANLSTALAIEPPLAGRVALSGPVAGQLANLSASLAASSEQVRWQHLSPRDVSATVALSSDAVRMNARRSVSVAAACREPAASCSGRRLPLSMRTGKACQSTSWSTGRCPATSARCLPDAARSPGTHRAASGIDRPESTRARTRRAARARA